LVEKVRTRQIALQHPSRSIVAPENIPQHQRIGKWMWPSGHNGEMSPSEGTREVAMAAFAKELAGE